MSTAAERVRALVSPICADLGLDLYDLEHAGGVVRVTIDREGGIDLDSLALATRLISRELDHADPIPGRYTLEVTSPGLERNLRTADHYRHAIGETVSLRTFPHVHGERRVRGTLLEADDDGFVVRLEGGDAPTATVQQRRLAYVDVERARTVFEWAAQAKPSARRPASGRPRSERARTPASDARDSRAPVEESTAKQ